MAKVGFSVKACSRPKSEIRGLTQAIPTEAAIPFMTLRLSIFGKNFLSDQCESNGFPPHNLATQRAAGHLCETKFVKPVSPRDINATNPAKPGFLSWLSLFRTVFHRKVFRQPKFSFCLRRIVQASQYASQQKMKSRTLRVQLHEPLEGLPGPAQLAAA